MAGVRHLDHWHVRGNQLQHVVPGALGERVAQLAVDDSHGDRQRGVVRRFPFAALEGERQLFVELPAPAAAVHAHQGLLGDVGEDVVVVAGLRREQPKARLGGLAVWIRLGPATAHQRHVGHGFVRMADAGIHQHEGAEAAREQIGGFRGHHAAEAVADDDHVFAQASGVAHRDDFLGVGFRVVAVAVVRIAHAGEVHRHHPVLVGKPRGDEVPPVAVRVHAVDQQHGLPAALPAPIDDVAFVHFDAVLGRFRLHRRPEPIGYGRAWALLPPWHRILQVCSRQR